MTAPAVTLVRAALFVDGTGATPARPADIWIENGRIDRVGPAGSLDPPQGAFVIDARGKTVIPGFVNLSGLPGLVRVPEQAATPFSRTEILRQLGVYASYGVTTVATPGQPGGSLLAIRDGIEAGAIASAARVLTPLRVIGPRVPDGLETVFEAVRSPGEAGEAVDRLAADGADFIEFRETLDAASAPVSLEMAAAVVDRANRHGLPVLAATPRAESAAAFAKAGARVIAASIVDREISDRLAREMLAAGTVYAPALFAALSGFAYGERAAWLDDRYLRRSLLSGASGLLRGPVRMRQALDPDRARKIARFDMARRNLAKLARSGVRIGFATGSGLPGSFEGYSEYFEAVLMHRAGLSALEVIRAFSEGSATALGIAGNRGALRPGASADLVVLNANPLENIHNLREMHAVLVAGRLAKL